jgi:hypothetical protein
MGMATPKATALAAMGHGSRRQRGFRLRMLASLTQPVAILCLLGTYLVAGAKFEPDNTRLMDKQRAKTVLLASELPYLIPAAIF